jgi:endonuclease/exonuclease/phosphatase family metal-dependent hydrolase
MKPVLKGVIALSLLGLIGAALPGESRDGILIPAGIAPAPGTVSVLTYNVHGAPWPATSGRSADLQQIGARLRGMRGLGRQPSIVVLQEAFSQDAQIIAREAGYSTVVSGAGKDDAGTAPMTAADRRFAAQAHWWKGETEGKFVGSGLQILSDYDILGVHRLAFPAFACAGWDCLANKGALLVTLAVPGGAPIDVLTTHLNSRTASRVPEARSYYAYDRQVEMLDAFVRAVHDPARPLIAAGDFNVGTSLPRRAALLAVARNWSSDATVRDAMHEYRQEGGAMSADAAYSFRRARDWQFFTDGTDRRISLAGIEVPFGFEASGGMLSDHVGYVARFRLSDGGAAASASVTAQVATRIARAKA